MVEGSFCNALVLNTEISTPERPPEVDLRYQALQSPLSLSVTRCLQARNVLSLIETFIKGFAGILRARVCVEVSETVAINTHDNYVEIMN